MVEDDLHTLTAEQAACILGVDPETVRRWARSGELPAMKWARRFHFRANDLIAFQDRHRIQSKDREAIARLGVRGGRRYGA